MLEGKYMNNKHVCESAIMRRYNKMPKPKEIFRKNNFEASLKNI